MKMTIILILLLALGIGCVSRGMPNELIGDWVCVDDGFGNRPEQPWTLRVGTDSTVTVNTGAEELMMKFKVAREKDLLWLSPQGRVKKEFAIVYDATEDALRLIVADPPQTFRRKIADGAHHETERVTIK